MIFLLFIVGEGCPLKKNEWLEDREQVAIRIPGRGGLFAGNREVPPGTMAYLPLSEDSKHIYRAGEEIPPDRDVALIKTGEFPLDLSWEGIRTEDGYDVRVELTLLVRVSSEGDHLQDFFRNILSRSRRCDTGTLGTYVQFPIKKEVSRFVNDSKLEALLEYRDLEPLRDRLRSELEDIFFQRGLEYRTLGDLEFFSEEYRRQQERQREKRERILSHEEELKEQKRREEKLEKVLEMLKSGTGKELMSEIPDREVKGQLYRSVVENNLLQENLEKAGQQLSDRLDRDAYEVLISAVHEVGGDPEEENPFHEEKAPETLCRDLYLVAGRRLLHLKPDRPGKPESVYQMEEPLRSVRVCSGPGNQEQLLLGARQSVIHFSPDEGDRTVYDLPSRSDVRGGVNAAAFVGDSLVSTHSEYGVVMWEKEQEEEGELVHTSITETSRTTRAVRSARDGAGFYFLSGPGVYYSTDGAREVHHLEPTLPAAGTDLVTGEKGIYAACGHRSTGSIAGWMPENRPNGNGEGSEGSLFFKHTFPITSLDFVQVAGVPCLVYTRDDTMIVARMLGSNLENTYAHSDLEMVLARGCSDRLIGLDSSGRYLLIWNNDRQEEPEREVDCMSFSNHPIYDLALSTRSGKA